MFIVRDVLISAHCSYHLFYDVYCSWCAHQRALQLWFILWCLLFVMCSSAHIATIIHEQYLMFIVRDVLISAHYSHVPGHRGLLREISARIRAKGASRNMIPFIIFLRIGLASAFRIRKCSSMYLRSLMIDSWHALRVRSWINVCVFIVLMFTIVRS